MNIPVIIYSSADNEAEMKNHYLWHGDKTSHLVNGRLLLAKFTQFVPGTITRVMA